MNIIVSKKTGKHMWENRYPNKGPTGIKITYGWSADPKASSSYLLTIADHVNAAEFADKIGKKLGEKCISKISARASIRFNYRIDRI